MGGSERQIDSRRQPIWIQKLKKGIFAKLSVLST